MNCVGEVEKLVVDSWTSLLPAVASLLVAHSMIETGGRDYYSPDTVE
jgi:hypothetical protein